VNQLSGTDRKRRQRLDRYDLLAEIASGGMATVYLGRLAGMGGFERLVAIKRLHPHLESDISFVEMFLDEARLAAKLHHPNVVSTLEVGATAQGHFLVMDYIEGDTLARLIARTTAKKERVAIAVSLRIIHDVLAGLQAAHDLRAEDGTGMNLVHRDVSPQNILVGVDGITRITDFGVARAEARLTTTRSGQVKGKLGYMAPEQARGDAIDQRTDIFAVGIVLWELLTGQRLFRSKSGGDVEVLHRIVYEEVPTARSVEPSVPAALNALCMRALARDSAERFPDCANFADALEAASAGTARMATPREVARVVDELVGHDVRARRSVLRSIAPPSDAASGSGMIGADVPKLPQSLSPTSLAEVSRAATVALRLEAPPPPSALGRSVVVGALSAFVVLSLGAAALLFLIPRERSAVSTLASSVPSVVATAPQSSASASVSSSASSASAPVASASASAPRATAPVATWNPRAAGPRPPSVASMQAPPKPPRPAPEPDNLSTNPYR
jgi:serine/threonine-protein kinase